MGRTLTCENCGHPVKNDHGFQRVMLGDCLECPDCTREAEQQGAQDDARDARTIDVYR
jgi:hypothetical protein